MGFAETFGLQFIAAINAMTPSLDSLYAGSHHYSPADWHARQVALVTASGVGSAVIPGMHVAGMLADLAFVVNRLGVAGYGIGAILGHRAGRGNVLDEDDMAAVVLYWVNADDFKAAMREAALGRGAAGVVPALAAHPAAVKVGIKTMMHTLGYLAGTRLGGKAGAKLGGKIAGKIAAKVSAKVSSKALLGFVPVLGALVGGGVNAWMLDGLLGAAKEYYHDKLGLLGDEGLAADRPAPA